MDNLYWSYVVLAMEVGSIQHALAIYDHFNGIREVTKYQYTGNSKR